MAFKMKSLSELFGFNEKHSIQGSVVIEKKMPKNVWAQIDINGKIDLNKNLNKQQKKEAINHERQHLKQIRTGVLHFDMNNYYYKPKPNKYFVIPNSKIDPRSRKLPWEASIKKYKK
tara:strand:+ start:756 stop:1106 length:351 start_codon:yes stop_codon:yes gene_type:complete